MSCDTTRPLLADYAAGAATDDERRLVEKHLAGGCDACRQELAELHEAAALLVGAEPLPQPPPHLRAQLLEAIGERPTVAAATPSRPRRRRGLALAIAAGLAAVAGGVAYLRSFDSDDARQVLADAWRSRVQQSEREFGVAGARLVSLPIDAFRNAVVTHVLYDSISEQLHVWAVNNPGAKRPNWAWLLDDEGAVVARGGLTRTPTGRLVAVLDAGDLTADSVRVVLTAEPEAPGDSPGDEVVEEGLLRIR